MAKTKQLTIIIVSFNTKEWTEQALQSIEQFAGTPVEVVVVDNGSTDGSIELIQSFSKVQLIEVGENLGFAKANNLALKQLKTPYAMLLNSDAQLTADTHLDKLLEKIELDASIGIITPKVVLADGSIDLACHRGEPTPWAALTYFLKLETLFPNSQLFGQYHQTWKNFDQLHQIDACSGAAMIIKKSVMDEVGLLDEQFFMYAEDLDWCKRVREAGYAIVYDPSSTVVHHKYKSGLAKQHAELNTDQYLHVPGFEKPTKKTNDHFYDTMKQYYHKHYGKNRSPLNTIVLKTIDFIRKIR